MNKISIQTDYIKLSAFLKYTGVVGTGGNAKDLILDRQVKVNGEICNMKGKKLYPGDIVTVLYGEKEEFLVQGQAASKSL